MNQADSLAVIVVRIKNHTVPTDYLETADEADDPGRERLERRVIDDLVFRDNRYKTRSENISDAVIGAKRMALGDEPAEKIAEFIALKLGRGEEGMRRKGEVERI